MKTPNELATVNTIKVLAKLGFKRVHGKAPFLTMRRDQYDVLIHNGLVEITLLYEGEHQRVYTAPDYDTVEQVAERLKQSGIE